jgi:hypothetical protein
MIDCTKTENYFLEKARMVKRQEQGQCGIKCRNCPLNSKGTGMDVSCSEFEILCPEKAIGTVQLWSNTHPQKTYLSELLKLFPDTPLNDDGTPDSICPYELGLMNISNCEKGRNCIECWNRPFGE